MDIFSQKLKAYRKSAKLTQQELADVLNKKYESSYNKGMISKWENGNGSPRMEAVRNIADHFNTTLDDLIGVENAQNGEMGLNDKDERDIQKELERMINDLDEPGAYAAFDGQSLEDMDEEDRELLKQSLEQSLRIAKRAAKQKFTPNKYRDK